MSIGDLQSRSVIRGRRHGGAARGYAGHEGSMADQAGHMERDDAASFDAKCEPVVLAPIIVREVPRTLLEARLERPIRAGAERNDCA